MLRRPRALKLLANAEKGLEKALTRAEQALEACTDDGLDTTGIETAKLLVEVLREARDKLDHGRSRIAQSIAARKLEDSRG